MNHEKQKILVVDDEIDVCDILKTNLSRSGYEVAVATNGKQALEFIKRMRPDVVLLDLIMNDISGIDVLSGVREYDKYIKFIVMTGDIDNKNLREDIARYDVSEILLKPIPLKTLKETLCKVLGKEYIKSGYPQNEPNVQDKDNFSKMKHNIANLLGIMINKCENYRDNIEDGLVKNRTDKEIIEESVKVVNEIIDAATHASKLLE
ncbi:MAG: response regulator [Candidatus Zapsychrus exili]|nr:response regulator [Candidatus Zapsychrus exili]